MDIGGGGGGAGWVAMTRLKLDKAANSSSKVSLSVPPSLNLLRLKIKRNNEISKMYTFLKYIKKIFSYVL